MCFLDPRSGLACTSFSDCISETHRTMPNAFAPLLKRPSPRIRAQPFSLSQHHPFSLTRKIRRSFDGGSLKRHERRDRISDEDFAWYSLLSLISTILTVGDCQQPFIRQLLKSKYDSSDLLLHGAFHWVWRSLCVKHTLRCQASF